MSGKIAGIAGNFILYMVYPKNRVKDFVEKHTTPPNVTIDDGLQYWRELLLRLFLLICTFLGLLVYLPSVALSIKEGLWVVAVADTIIYGFILILFFTPSFSYGIRAITISLLSYILGMVLLLTIGPHGGGPVWLFAFPIVVAILLGLRNSIIALIINIGTIVIVGILLQVGLVEWGYEIINPVEKWIVVSFNFLFLNINITMAVAIIMGGIQNLVNRQKTMLIALEESQVKFKSLFEFAPDAYYLNDPEGTFVNGNKAAEDLLGYQREELTGSNLMELNILEPKELPRVLELLNKNRLGEGTGPDEFTMIRKNGEKVLVEVRTLPTEVGGKNMVLGIARDISERKRLEESLRKAQKMEMIGTLAGGVAHDLNNVLSGIVSYPDLLLMDIPKDSTFRKPVQAIKEAGERAAAIVQDLLTLGRRGVPISEVINLNDIITTQLNSQEFAKIKSLYPDITVESRLEPALLNINCSSIQLSKAFMNLIYNAVEAMPSAGNIIITTENRSVDLPIHGYEHIKEGDYVLLMVSDDGIGISSKDKERIFEPFYTKKVMGRSGTGLGMSVVWGAVKDHKGHIDIKSKEGEGTTFIFYFPATWKTAMPDEKFIPIEKYMGNGETLLIVDDIAEQREITSGMLTKLGYSVASAASGEKAVEYIQTHSVDLLVLDMIMEPGIDGLETYKRVREYNPGQKAIIVSGFSETERVKEAQSLGAVKYIKKPYTMKTIACAVKEELQRS